jgi:membrane protein involved in colicin uptake
MPVVSQPSKKWLASTDHTPQSRSGKRRVIVRKERLSALPDEAAASAADEAAASAADEAAAATADEAAAATTDEAAASAADKAAAATADDCFAGLSHERQSIAESVAAAINLKVNSRPTIS